MQNKIFVRNLAFSCEDADLNGLFSPFGEVSSARIATDRDTGRGRGFGFVEMANQQQAEAAIRSLNGTDFGGRYIHVAVAEPRESNRSGSRGGRY